MKKNLYSLIVICGPAGVGKTTVAKAILKIYPQLRTGVTYTTRNKRQHSTEDKKIYYISTKEFKKRREDGEFLEWAVVHGDLYGTHKVETEEVLHNHPVLFNIDVQGAAQMKQIYGKRVVTIFLLPESHEQLIDHLKTRGEMTEGKFEQRLKSAEKELARKDEFDYQIINVEGQINQTINHIHKILDPIV